MANEKKSRWSRLKTVWKIVLGILLVLIILRICLPHIVLHYANKRLAEMPGYYGRIYDLDIHLYRGAYTLKQMYLNKVDSQGKQTPFFYSKTIDLALEWRSLFHGRIVAKLAFDTTVMRFTKDKVNPKKLNEDSTSFRTMIKGFMPLKINRVEVTNGQIQYLDPTSIPKVDIAMKRTYVLATNLSNVADSASLTPSTIDVQSDVYGGIFIFHMAFNPLIADPTFALQAELRNTNLAQFNPFLLAYAGIDVAKGNLNVYSEVAAKNGDYRGYVKPIIKDLKVLGPQDANKSFLHKVYETLIGAAAFVLTNHAKDQIASRIELEGTFKSTNVDFWGAVFAVLRNAFVQALFPSLDNDININTVGPPKKPPTLWERVFGGSAKGSAKKKSKK